MLHLWNAPDCDKYPKFNIVLDANAKEQIFLFKLPNLKNVPWTFIDSVYNKQL